jgi:hypothetical protein
LPFFIGINVIHYPVNANGTKHADERIKNNIGIIITKTENVEDRKYFNKRIALQIIPIRILGPEKFEYATGIRVVKQVDHIFRRILKQQFIFLDTAVVVTPCIHHLGMIAIINSNPTIKDPRHHFQKENDDELGLAQARTNKKFCFGCKPGKQHQVNGK